MQPVIQTLEILAGTTGYLMIRPDEVLRKVAGNDVILKLISYRFKVSKNTYGNT